MDERLRYFNGQVKLAISAHGEAEIKHSLNVIDEFRAYLSNVIKSEIAKEEYIGSLDNLSYKLIERLNSEKRIKKANVYQKIYQKNM